MSRFYGPCLLFALWSCSTSKAVDGAAMIGPSGGTVSLPSGPSLQVPAGALSGDIRIAISATGRLAPNGSQIIGYPFYSADCVSAIFTP
jgi:hypothetical protein